MTELLSLALSVAGIGVALWIACRASAELRAARRDVLDATTQLLRVAGGLPQVISQPETYRLTTDAEGLPTGGTTAMARARIGFVIGGRANVVARPVEEFTVSETYGSAPQESGPAASPSSSQSKYWDLVYWP